MGPQNIFVASIPTCSILCKKFFWKGFHAERTNRIVQFTSSSLKVVLVSPQLSYCTRPFTQILLDELMKQYNTVNSGELKALSNLLTELMVLDDPLQSDRLQFVIDGRDGVDGLLALVKNNQATDSRRSYQCIKTLVNASNRSQAVKERLLRDPDRWQWAVNWLKGKMGNGKTINSDKKWRGLVRS